MLSGLSGKKVGASSYVRTMASTLIKGKAKGQVCGWYIL